MVKASGRKKSLGEEFSYMDFEEVEQEIHEFLQEKLEETGAKGYVIGLSGGIDSTTTATLAVDAVGEEKVKGLIMPGAPSREENMGDARDLAEELGIDFEAVEIDQAAEVIEESLPFSVSEKTRGNIRARVRMSMIYAEANEENLLVLGSSNRTEILTGYFTKYGDEAADLRPVADLYKTELKQLAEHIGVGQKFIEKKPTAGLWEGQTDQNELGASYEVLDKVLKQIVDEELSVERTAAEVDVDAETVREIQELYECSLHKREEPDFPDLR